MRVSKNPKYKNPYSVTGAIKQEGSERKPKRIFWSSLLKRGNLITFNNILPYFETVVRKGIYSITYIYISESSGIVPVKP